MARRSVHGVRLVSHARSDGNAGGGQVLRFRVGEGKDAVWLQQRKRGASIQLERGRGRGERVHCATECWFNALELAEREVKSRQSRPQDPLSVTSGPLDDPTIGSVIEWYSRRRFQGDRPVSDQHRRQLERVFAIVDCWAGISQPVSFFTSAFVHQYLERRREAFSFPIRYHRAPLRGAGRRKAVKELQDLAGVLEHARTRGFIKTHPLVRHAWTDYLDGDTDAAVHYVECHPELYRLLMVGSSGQPECAAVSRTRARDGGKRLRAFMATLFFTGHRAISCLSVDCEDVAFSQEEVRALLAQAPNHRTWWAAHYPNGGILWRRSKAGFVRFTPLHPLLGRELMTWREAHPEWQSGRPLFPSIKNARRRMNQNSMRAWAYQAREVARIDSFARPRAESHADQWLGGAILHGWRDHYATMMDRMGYGWTTAVEGHGHWLGLHNYVAFLSDFATRGGTQSQIYAKLDPVALQMIANFDKAEVVKRYLESRTEDEVTSVLNAVYGDVSVGSSETAGTANTDASGPSRASSLADVST